MQHQIFLKHLEKILHRPILINKPYRFQKLCVVETVYSDFQKVIVTVTKITLQKLRPRAYIQ